MSSWLYCLQSNHDLALRHLTLASSRRPAAYYVPYVAAVSGRGPDLALTSAKRRKRSESTSNDRVLNTAARIA